MFPSHDQSMLAGLSGFVKNIFEAKKLRSLSFIAMKMIFQKRKNISSNENNLENSAWKK